jgi:hypothetical protein
MSDYRSDLIDIVCTLHAETEKAIFVSDDGEKDNAVWLPKSQIEYELRGRTGSTIVTMPEWLAKDKGLI